jgi:hypothetical protein
MKYLLLIILIFSGIIFGDILIYNPLNKLIYNSKHIDTVSIKYTDTAYVYKDTVIFKHYYKDTIVWGFVERQPEIILGVNKVYDEMWGPNMHLFAIFDEEVRNEANGIKKAHDINRQKAINLAKKLNEER